MFALQTLVKLLAAAAFVAAVPHPQPIGETIKSSDLVGGPIALEPVNFLGNPNDQEDNGGRPDSSIDRASQ
ncbi:hypothetical protein CSOJ01_11943 [Colletotrichum sojae]|uniref:Uncharacterized protein n=1 Tax=Colletotrichum sojae TaxID=2175907 RepID=A0A8H6IX06_9PEZI|nr:hypothetical protein CSOJ01_11943 [Colletotrichum sojae]